MTTFTEKYTPASLNEVVLNDADGRIRRKLELIVKDELQDNLILVGPYGSGKTKLARLLPRLFYDNHQDTETEPYFVKCEMSGDFNISNINNFANWAPWTPAERNWVVLNEADKLKPKDQLSLLTPMDDHRTAFILTANELDKIDPGLQDRAEILHIAPPTPEQFLPRAQFILKAEGVSIIDDNVLSILSAAKWSMREYMRALNMTIVEYRHATNRAA